MRLDSQPEWVYVVGSSKTLIENGDEDRTRHNRVQNVVTFLRNEEGRRPGPPIKDVSIRVKYVEAPPEAYTRQELEDLFRVSDKDAKFLWRFFLGTGFRESEVSVAEITDVNRDTKTIRVDEKPYFGFKPKDCEKRNVPISDVLIAEIAARAKSAYRARSSSGTTDDRTVTFCAYSNKSPSTAVSNCGKCKGKVDGKEVSCAEAPVCEKWILHRFRRNFATDRRNGGAPARKIQKWLGHADLETTLRYLAVGEDTSEEVRTIVNGVHVGL